MQRTAAKVLNDHENLGYLAKFRATDKEDDDEEETGYEVYLELPMLILTGLLALIDA